MSARLLLELGNPRPIDRLLSDECRTRPQRDDDAESFQHGWASLRVAVDCYLPAWQPALQGLTRVPPRHLETNDPFEMPRPTRPNVSAGLLLFRRSGAGLEVFIAHPGGPFWRDRDVGAWTMPKGIVEAGEDLLDAARREFVEETSIQPNGPFIPLGSIRQKAGKTLPAGGGGRTRRSSRHREQHDAYRVAPRFRSNDRVSGARSVCVGRSGHGA